MKKLVTLLALVIGLTAGAQTYVNVSASYYNGAGEFKKQAMGTVELGKVLSDDFTAGIAVGKTSFSNDGEYYVQFRPTYYLGTGRFTQGITVGAGYVFDSETPFLVELATSSNFQLSPRLGANVAYGLYNFNGRHAASEFSYFGTGLTLKFGKIK